MYSIPSVIDANFFAFGFDKDNSLLKGIVSYCIRLNVSSVAFLLSPIIRSEDIKLDIIE